MIVRNIPSQSKAAAAASALPAAAAAATSSQQPPISQSHRFRIACISATPVGKTSICNRWSDTPQPFSDRHVATLGIDLYLKRMHHGNMNQLGPELQSTLSSLLPSTEEEISLQIMEGVGGTAFRQQIYGNFLVSCEAIVIPYDVTNRQTLDDALDTIDQLRKSTRFAEKEVPPPICLLGNKLDLLDQANYQQQQQQQQNDYYESPLSLPAEDVPVGDMCNAREIVFLGEVSAKTGAGIDSALASLTELVMENKVKKLEQRSEVVARRKRLAERRAKSSRRHGFFGFETTNKK